MKSLRFRKISEAFLFFLPSDLFLLCSEWEEVEPHRNNHLIMGYDVFTRIFAEFLLFPCPFFISQILDPSVWEDDADFCSHELEKDYADFLGFSSFYGYSDDFYYYNFLLCLFFCDNFV